jgi:hypothetical protein
MWDMQRFCRGFILALSLSAFIVSQPKAQQIATDSLELHLNEFFKQKSVEALKNDLSENFSVAAYNLPSAERFLQTIADRYKCDSVQVRNSEKTGDSIKLTAVFYSKEKNTQSSIYLDRDHKIHYVDLFDQLYGMNRYQPSRLIVKVPFETDEHGSVYLRVTLNGINRPLKFLFDTGADGMAITQSLADSLGLKATRQRSTSVVGGTAQISISENNTIHLDTFSILNQNIALFKEMRGNADGIIGNTIAKTFITKVDFDKKELSLFSFGTYQYSDKGTPVPVKLPAGVFMIPGALSVTKDKPYTGQFVFDIGAAYSLICFRPFVIHNRLLVDGFKPEYNGTTTSMGISTPTFSGRAFSFSFSHMQPIQDMPVTLMSGGGETQTWNPGADGSIGTRIISRYNFTINMQQKEIYFVPNKSYNNPYDFVLNTHLFGFDTDGQLRVQAEVRPTEGALIKPGAIVKSINGISVEALRNDKKKLSQLTSLPPATEFNIAYIR